MPCGGCKSVGWPLREIADHGTHEAIYIEDPDGNDLELCWDRPFEQWPRDEQGHIAFAGGELNLDDLLTEPPYTNHGSSYPFE